MSKKTKKLSHPVVLVEWFDSHDALLEWTHEDDIEVEEVYVTSVGFKVYETDRYIVLSCSNDGNNHHGGGIVIPLVNIVKVTKL